MADNDVPGRENERQLNAIACIHCRQRKRKCDRRLPHCLQCSHDPASCQYPEQHRRGIPIGFMTRMEARLAETEEALFQVLQTLDSSNRAQLSLRPSPERKSERVKEWDSLPLKSLNDIEAWFQKKAEVNANREASRTGQPESSRRDVPMRSIVTDTDFDIGDSYDAGDETTSFSGNRSSTPGDGTWSLDSGTLKSKAEVLEQKRPHIYF